MSKRKPGKKNVLRDGKDAALAYYVYCIGEREALAPLLGEQLADATLDGELPGAIESDAYLELVVASELAAVVSGVPLADYGEGALQASLDDPAWTAIRAMRHEKVVERLASRASVIPIRFGTVYLSRERIAEMLLEKQAELRSIAERLRGREEWGVNVYRNRARLMEVVVSLSPRLREMSERRATSSPGQAYLLQKKIDALRSDEARIETRRVIAEIESELAGASEASARLRIQKDEASEQGEVAAKLAFLVERARFDRFHDVAEQLAAKYAESGFQIEMTGPWPAYNFAA